MNKKQKITFGLIVGLIFLISMGITYAYFSLGVRGNENAKNMTTTMGKLEITYNETNIISVSNIMPGWSSEDKVVTITNTGTLPASYNLIWSQINNTFIRKEILMSLACTSTENNCSDMDIPVTINGTTYTYDDEAEVAYFGSEKLIKENFEIEPGATQTLTLKFYFKETGENQNYNQGKIFTGKLKVSEYTEIVASGTLSNKWAVNAGYFPNVGAIANTEGDKVSKINFYSDGRTFNGITSTDVSKENNNSVKLYQITTNDCPDIKTDNGSTWTTLESCYEVNIVANGVIDFPTYSQNLFSNLKNVSEINFNDSVNTRNVTDMSYMFYSVGINAKELNIDINTFDTSNVMNMHSMFANAGQKVTTFEIDLSNWDLSNVTDMSNIFSNAGQSSTTFKIDLSNWDLSNVTDMSSMFFTAGQSSTTFDVGDLSNWDISSATNISGMFQNAGYNAPTWSVGDLSNWDTSNVTDMHQMFNSAGYSASTWDIGDVGKWNMSMVTSVKMMFQNAGHNATTWNIGDLSNWDTSSVTDMSQLFTNACNNAEICNIGNLSDWDISNTIVINGMFSSMGLNAITFDVGNLDNWDTSSVENMKGMFYCAGRNSTTWNVGNLSNWDTSNVTDMRQMFNYAGFNASKFDVGDLSNWNTTQVTLMTHMFSNAGTSASVFNIGNISSWNTSKVTDMTYMFWNAGQNAPYTLNLSGWNVNNVISHSGFNSGVTAKVTQPIWIS